MKKRYSQDFNQGMWFPLYPGNIVGTDEFQGEPISEVLIPWELLYKLAAVYSNVGGFLGQVDQAPIQRFNQPLIKERRNEKKQG